MSESPYLPPQANSFDAPSSSDDPREPLRRVAKYQRRVIFALLATIICNIVVFLDLAGESFLLNLALLIVSLGVVVFAIYSTFLLAKQVINVGVAVVCAILVLVPFVSLIVLLVVNQKATTYLQQHGIKVGFMGVDPSCI